MSDSTNEDDKSRQIPINFSAAKKRKLKKKAAQALQRVDQRAATGPQPRFSKFVVYVDESGDHALDPKKINPQFPVFALAFCVFYKSHYCDVVIPQIQRFKFRYFGHDQINLHEKEIRDQASPFDIFKNKKQHLSFIARLGAILERCNFILIASVIEKMKLSQAAAQSANAYHISLRFCMESLYEFLLEHNEHDALTHIIVERRGPREDKEVELEFRRICDRQNKYGILLPFELILIDKTRLSTGLQLADLVARPVALSVLRPEQQNNAFEILKNKFYCRGGRDAVGSEYLGLGLKIFPETKS